MYRVFGGSFSLISHTHTYIHTHKPYAQREVRAHAMIAAGAAGAADDNRKISLFIIKS